MTRTRGGERRRKVSSAENPSDLLTKYLGADLHSKHTAKLSYEFPVGDSTVEKALGALETCSGIWSRVRIFAKHLGIAKTQGKWIEGYLESLGGDRGAF